MTKLFHIEIDKCEDCPFRQYNYKSDGCREEEGDWCFFPGSLVLWVSKNTRIYKGINFTWEWKDKNQYEGDFPEGCPLEDMIKI